MKKLVSLCCMLFMLVTSPQIILSQNIPSVSNQEIKQVLESTVKRLTTYINYCGTANIDPQTKEFYLDLILDEFEDGATMEVSNVFRGTETSYPVKKYFRNLIYLKDEENYSKVFFGFSNIKITELTRDKKDGTKYLAIGEFTQTFKAFRGDQETYADITVKFSNLHVRVTNGVIKVKIGNTWVKSTKYLNHLKG